LIKRLQVITALNAVRNVALADLRQTAADEMRDVLLECCSLLANVPVTRKLSGPERAAHLAACKALVDTACPLIVQLFQQVSRDLCQHAGLYPTYLR
jgi:hypothetical protein